MTQLGPLPEPLATAPDKLTQDDSPQFSARDMRAYAAAEVARAVAQDCRLCANFTTASGGCVSVLRCVAGDRYKPTTPRQLWEAAPVEPSPF